MYYKNHKILCQEILEQELKSLRNLWFSSIILFLVFDIKKNYTEILTD
jgi:hypothetical protein